MRAGHLLRAVINGINLSTLLGLAIAALGKSQLTLGSHGRIFAENYRLGFPVAGAFTVGNVVIFPRKTLEQAVINQPDVLAHEDRHSTQWAFGGLLFLPAYLIANSWSWLRTGDIWSANAFERAAGLASGGYPEQHAKRGLAEGTRAGVSSVKNVLFARIGRGASS